MRDDDKRSNNPLVDRVKERFRDLVDELSGKIDEAISAIDDLMRPAPVPVPIPVRSRRRR